MQIGDNLQTPGMKLKCLSVPKQHLQLLQATDESLDLCPRSGPQRTRRQNFSRLPQSQRSTRFSQDRRIFKPKAEEFTRSITDKGRSPSRKRVKKPLFPRVPKKLAECHLPSVVTPPHIHTTLELPRKILPTCAGCQQQSDGTARKPSSKTHPTLPKHLSEGKLMAALERVCNPCGWESCSSPSWTHVRSSLSHIRSRESRIN